MIFYGNYCYKNKHKFQLIRLILLIFRQFYCDKTLYKHPFSCIQILNKQGRSDTESRTFFN